MDDKTIVLAARGIAQHLLLSLNWSLARARQTLLYKKPKHKVRTVIAKLLKCQSDFMGPTPRAVGIDLVTEAAASKIQQSLDVKHVKQNLYAETVQVDRIKPHIKIDLLHTHPNRIWLRFYSTNPIFMLWLPTTPQHIVNNVRETIASAVARHQPSIATIVLEAVDNTSTKENRNNDDDDDYYDNNVDIEKFEMDKKLVCATVKRSAIDELTQIISRDIVAKTVELMRDAQDSINFEEMQSLANNVAIDALEQQMPNICNLYAKIAWFKCNEQIFSSSSSTTATKNEETTMSSSSSLCATTKPTVDDIDPRHMLVAAPFPYATTTIRVCENVYEIYINDKNDGNCMRLLHDLPYIGCGRNSAIDDDAGFKFDLIFCSELTMFLYSPLLFLSNYIKFMWCYTANREIFDPKSFEDIRLLTSHTTYGLMFLNTNNLSSMPKTTHGPLIACSGERPKIALNKFDANTMYVNEGSRALQSVDKPSDFGTVSNFIEIISEIELTTNTWIGAIK